MASAAPVASLLLACATDRPLLVINRVSVSTELIKALTGREEACNERLLARLEARRSGPNPQKPLLWVNGQLSLRPSLPRFSASSDVDPIPPFPVPREATPTFKGPASPGPVVTTWRPKPTPASCHVTAVNPPWSGSEDRRRKRGR